MSIWSDHDCGALSDEDFERECIRMNNRDRIERDEQEVLWDDDREESGLIAED